MTDPAPRFRDKPVSFVRRSGRMSDAQERAWQDLSAHYVIDVERDAAATSVRPGTQIAPGVVFGRRAPLVVEIGSGQGHAIVHAASTSPERDFLAVEVFRAGLARTMLDAHRIAFYETPPSGWGLFAGGIFVRENADIVEATYSQRQTRRGTAPDARDDARRE